MKKPTDREPIASKAEGVSSKLKMKAKPNWVEIDSEEEDTPDRFRVPPNLIPEGMIAQWVTDSVFGQPVPQHRAAFEKKGWTPVHQEDFDGAFDGRYMPKGRGGEIIQDGMVLMMRPKELSEQADLRNRRRALEQVALKEQSLLSGNVGVTLDGTHPSAVKTNRISKSFERIDVPTEK